MNNKKTVFVCKQLIIGLIVLISILFTACYNPIMEKWWPEPEIKVDPPAPPPVKPPDGSGENFGIVFFDTDGGTPQPKAVKVAWGSTVGRLRPVSRGIDGFMGWYDENDELWNVETRPVMKEDDVDGDGFITLTSKWVETIITIPPPQPGEPPVVAPVYIVRFIPYPAGVTPPVSIDISQQFPDQYIASGSKAVQPLKPPVYNNTHGFDGWYTEPNCIHRWNFDLPVSTSVTLYAGWALDTRTVRFVPNGGTRPDGITQLTHEFTVSLNYGLVQNPGPLVRQGYNFAGWYMYPDFSGAQWDFENKKVTDTDVPVTGSVTTLYAKWERNKYFVDFVITPSTSVTPAQQTIFYGEKVIRPRDVRPPAGSRLEGWYTEKTFANRWDFDNSIITSNVTLYAKFVSRDTPGPIDKPDEGSGENFGIVFFDTNGGTPQPKVVKVAWGETVGRLRPVSRGPEGINHYGFMGWYDENDELWDVETRPVMKEDDVDGDGFITLTIRWSMTAVPPPPPPPVPPPVPPPPAPVYIVRFVPYPADVTPPAGFDIDEQFPDQYIAAGSKAVEPVKPPSYKNALNVSGGFAGWYTEPECIHKWNFDLPVSTSVTLYAKWEFDEIRIVRFEPNGGTRPDGITELTHEFTIARSYGLVQNPGPLIKEGYSFAGWYMFSNFTHDQWDFAIKNVFDSDVPVSGQYTTLYAKWEINRYFVNFDITPSTAAAPVQQSITHGENVTRPVDPQMLGDGRGFVSWYTENEHFNQWDFNNPVTGNMTLYARFAPQTRTVHFQPNGGLTSSGMEMRSSVTIPIASGMIINPGSLVRAGYTFGGWYSDPACITPWNFIMDRVTVPDEIIAMDPMYLYAKWTTNPYTVTFNWYEAASPITETQSVKHGERAARPNTPVNTGRSLVGWFTQDGRSTGQWGTEWVFDTRTVTSNVTLHANWEDSNYTVKFHFGSPPVTISSVYIETELEDQHHSIHEKITEPFMPPLPSVDRTSYSFVRWDYHPNPDANPADVNNPTFRNALQPWDFNTEINDSYTSTGEKVLNLYARWVEPDPDMVWVPRGSFIMGDSGVSGTPAAYHSYPTRRVTLDGFFISRYPITQVRTSDTNKTYQDVTGGNPSQFSRNDQRPVERVSWYDAINFCIELNKLSGSLAQTYTMTGIITAATALSQTAGIRPIIDANVSWDDSANGYRLPTEAEWEYAAKGGNGMGPYFIYSGSNDPTEVAWYNETVKNEPAGLQATQTVGRKNPNTLGIYDMSGNVSEWVWDWFGSYNPVNTPYYGTSAALNNPRGPATGNERVRRGGGWSNAAGNVRSVVRNSDTPDKATWVHGFRVVRGPSQIW